MTPTNSVSVLDVSIFVVTSDLILSYNADFGIPEIQMGDVESIESIDKIIKVFLNRKG